MKSILIASLVLASSSALAATQNLSFADLQAACKDPMKFQNQIQPTSIKLDCSETILRWVPGDAAETKMTNQRVISYAISSDKYLVALNKESFPMAESLGACPSMKQVEETVTLSQEVTCDQVQNFDGTAGQYCANLLDSMKGANQSAVQTKETGRLVTFCGPSEQGAAKSAVRAADEPNHARRQRRH